INFSMSQWYPKICAYDNLGWHPTPYIAREFYGEFGNFDVEITINKKYYIASTGYLKKTTLIDDKKTWFIHAQNVHDFMWAADTTYVDIFKTITDTIGKKKRNFNIHVIYKPSFPKQDSSWIQLLEDVVKVYPYIAKHFGHYPYKKYSFIQGGDGGMEYPMATLIKGSSIGTAFHEFMHSWYQGVIATNESLYPWMDEGAATFSESRVSAFYKQYILKKPLDSALPLYHANSYKAYFFMQKMKQSEPLTTHADYYPSNFAYSISSYAKGAIFLEQLGYIIGAKKRDELLLKYFEKFKFKHPTSDDFIHLAQYFSQIQLDWYKEGWINSTRYIDYAIDSVYHHATGTTIVLQSKGDLYMPIDLVVTLKNGHKIMHYIPLYTMFGKKENEDTSIKRILHKPWKWTNIQYTLHIHEPIQNIAQIEIDPSERMADIDRKNNIIILN
ncbi:MAG: M1 family aminopeptidase, partial [Chitinophagaceae bacterium]